MDVVIALFLVGITLLGVLVLAIFIDFAMGLTLPSNDDED